MTRLLLAVVVALGALLLLSTCVQKVPLDRVGVVTNNFGGGVAEQDQGAGYVWIWPGMQTLSLWDPTVQVIHLERTPQRDTRVNIRGKDQYTTQLDMTVIFRIGREGTPARTLAWRVARTLGSMEKLRDITLSTSNKIIWEVMSDLATEEFYASLKRGEHAERAKVTLQKTLLENGVQVEVLDVLVRKIDYDRNFESRLLEKQLLEQDQLLQTSLAKAEVEKQVTEKIQKETEAAVKRITEERQKEVKTLLAEKEKRLRQIEGDTGLYTMEISSGAQRYLKERTAEGGLLVEQGRAKGEEAINAAYRQAGGEYLLGKKVLENLEFGTIEINTNQWNPFDIEETLRKILGRGADLGGAPASKPPK